MEVLAKLRGIAVLDFLMSNVRTEHPKRRRQSMSADSPTALRSSTSGTTPPASYTSTLMESLFMGDWATITVPDTLDVPGLITYWSRRWMSGLDLSTQYESCTAHVLADLIKHEDEILASAFLPYVTTTGWSTYLKGRLSLLLGDFESAAKYFKKAAFSVCKYKGSLLVE
jgi:nuclear pore complex protein Nup160